MIAAPRPGGAILPESVQPVVDLAAIAEVAVASVQRASVASVGRCCWSESGAVRALTFVIRGK